MSLCMLPLLASLALAQEPPVALEAPPDDVAPPMIEIPSVDRAIGTGAIAKRDAALIIGNQSYDWLPEAPYARNDAAAVYEHLRYTRGLSSSHLRTLNDASVDEMRKGLRRATGRVWRNGTLWIYFAGHAATTPDGRRVLLGTEQASDEAVLVEQGFPIDELVALVTRSHARQVVLIVDASFGRQARDGSFTIVGRDALTVPPFAGVDNANVTAWVASTGDQQAGMFPAVRHGLFTWATLGALRGWADGAQGELPDGMVTLGEAQTYVSDVLRHFGRFQVPSMDGRPDVQDWVMAEFEAMETGPSPVLYDQLSELERQRTLAAVIEEAAERAAMDWMRVQALVDARSPEAEQALSDYIRDWERPRLSIQWVQYVPYVREAQRELDHWDAIMASAPPEVAEADPAPPDDTAPPEDTGTSPAPQAPEDDSCKDFLKLQDQALAGGLRGGQMACLEVRIATDKLMTDRDKASRILLVDAEAKKDLTRWELLMVRHLHNIDQSDPDLCFKYTIYLSKKGMQNAEEVIIWGSRALERKDTWSGRLYEKKVFALHQLRAEAAMHLWQQAEKRYLAERTLQNDAATDDARARAKEFARAWLDYARASEQDVATAFKLCLSAAGAEEYCGRE
ncbi:MAG: caspase family protein [Pseudomonadota bacterium]